MTRPLLSREDRPSRRHFVALMLSAASAPTLAGCDPRQAAYFLQPFEAKIPAPCPSLKGKRVVILTSVGGGLPSDQLSVDREISRRLAAILRDKIKKIDIVNPDEVQTWAQAKPTWTDPADAARAFEADIVIFLEVREFQVQNPSSPGLYEGRSNIHIQVTELAHPTDSRGKPMTDRPKQAQVIHESDRSTVFPITGHIPVEAGISPAVFRNRFLEIVTAELSWEFVEHARGDDIQNTRFRE
ncbi:MAG: hypothetical protein KatS3mg108_1047 [Isosphaeraceae bacterium]|jgi:hypothetical protein|nr:MAG: hypothetical protein KatS3mg108_1047 [Isosphaeraceae bacterium]